MRTITATAITLAALCLAGAPARAEMVYRMATMGEPKTLDPHGVSGTWENYIVGDSFMGLLTDAADAKPVAGAAQSWQISDDGLDLHLQAARPSMVRRAEGDGRGLRVLDAPHPRPEAGGRVRLDHVPDQERGQAERGRDAGDGEPGRAGDRPADAGGHAGEPGRLLPRADDALHLVPGAQARGGEVRAGVGEARRPSSATAPTTSSNGRRTRAWWRRRTRTSTTPPTSRSTR